jgi:hypothetical protein
VLPARVLLLACAAGCVAATAAAQTPADVRRDAQIRLGPVYASPRFAIEELGVDSNVFNNAEEKRDFTFTVAPAASIWVPFGQRALFTADVGADVVYYQQYASERSIDPGVRLRGDVFIGRTTPFVEIGYLRTRQRPNFEVDVRSLREERDLRAGVDVRLFSKVSVELNAGYRPVTFGQDARFNDVSLRETLNRTSTTAALVARYAATPLTTVMLTTEATRDRFELSPLRNADSLRIVPGVELNPRALISGSAHVGFRRFAPLNGALEPFTGLVASTSLSYTLRGTTKVTVTASRDITYSYERVQPYFVVASVGLAVRRQIVGPIDVSAAVQRETYRYRDLLLPGATAADLDRVDRLFAWSGSVGYRIGRNMRAGMGTAYRARQSNSARLRDYEGFRVITTVDYDF